MNKNIFEKGYAAPVDVLMDIGVLSKKDYEDWRAGRVPFLEKVCQANLSKLSNIMREIRTFAAKNNLKASWTFYRQYGKGNKQKLRFSKSGNETIEKAYATHYMDTGAKELRTGN